ncbi:BnaC04g22250D [Brassica napus]|uniref:BnaC04g22250D protein n=1 Tax=Brassica napus TaxID=3708 RepID=A0A078HYB4_BRANA|nr:BnaC04g22250D [Brassica napus]
MDFGQCDGTDFGQWDGKEKDDAEEEEKEKSGKEKEKSGEVDKDKENSETDEENDSERELNELKERCRVQADELWREVEAAEAEEDQANDERKEAATNEESIENSEDDEKVEASESPNSEPRFESPINSPINEPRVEADKTPTPPSGGRTKAMAARRVVVVEAKEKAIEKAVELEKKTSEEKAVEAEEKTSEKVVERMDGTKEATRPRIRHRCKEKTMTSGKPTPKRRGRPRRSIADAAPKKSDCTPHASKGRGKRKCEPSQWVRTPFTRGKKPKTKA